MKYINLIFKHIFDKVSGVKRILLHFRILNKNPERDIASQGSSRDTDIKFTLERVYLSSRFADCLNTLFREKIFG